jgi:methanogenic corrinoid protein MtbC1
MGVALRPPPAHAEKLQEALLLALRAGDQTAAHGIVDRASALGWSPDELRCDLITPTLHEVGRRWEIGELGVAEEHLASAICEWLLAAIAGRTPRTVGPDDRRAVVGCPGGELHALGAMIVANVLAERGWRVLYLGAATPPDAWGPIVRARRMDAAVISTTTAAAVAQVPETLRAIREARRETVTVVGGQAFTSRRIGRGVGAGLVVDDPRDLAAQLDTVLA